MNPAWPILGIMIWLGGCAGQGDERLESSEPRPIIGGVEDLGDSAVVMVETRDGMCTGTLVAPRVVLTAAHCMADSIAGGVIDGTVSFGNGIGDFFARRNIVAMFAHRRYSVGLYQGFDIGLVRLDEPAPAEVVPVPVNVEPLNDSILGAVVRAVGFGVSDGQAQTGAGVKRTVFLTVSGLSDEHMVVGDAVANTCQGDSGGPVLYSVNGEEVIFGITSFGEAGCAGPSNKTRVDRYVDEFLAEVMAAWDGPCVDDGLCVTDGCGAFADPDCDPCGFQGVCAQGCERIDLDCPVAGLLGDPCADDYGCEGRLCVTASDDPRVQYCSRSCGELADCDPPATVCGPRGVCEFPGPTPSTQGAACVEPDDCRSGLCDAESFLCVEPCGNGLAECAEGFACAALDTGERACRIAGQGGCAIAPASGHESGAGWLLLLAALWLRRARK